MTQIIQSLTSHLLLSPLVSLPSLASQTEFFSGADLGGLIGTAHLASVHASIDESTTHAANGNDGGKEEEEDGEVIVLGGGGKAGKGGTRTKAQEMELRKRVGVMFGKTRRVGKVEGEGEKALEKKEVSWLRLRRVPFPLFLRRFELTLSFLLSSIPPCFSPLPARLACLSSSSSPPTSLSLSKLLVRRCQRPNDRGWEGSTASLWMNGVPGAWMGRRVEGIGWGVGLVWVEVGESAEDEAGRGDALSRIYCSLLIWPFLSSFFCSFCTPHLMQVADLLM